MRLWHYQLIPFLPKGQLIAQWRELNSILKSHPNHILINYIYEYPKSDLEAYADIVYTEMVLRGYRISKESRENFFTSFSNFPTILTSSKREFKEMLADGRAKRPFANHQDDEYLVVCYFNLLEKYRRGQKEFYGDEMQALRDYCEPAVEKYANGEGE